jgi:hypothetical protein
MSFKEMFYKGDELTIRPPKSKFAPGNREPKKVYWLTQKPYTVTSVLFLRRIHNALEDEINFNVANLWVVCG